MGLVLTPINATGVDLVSAEYVTRVLAAANIPAESGSPQAAILPSLITASSREVVRYCGRPFVLQSFDEIVSPEGARQDRCENEDFHEVSSYDAAQLTERGSP